jgi:MFS family permease
LINSTESQHTRIIIWLVGVSFLLFQFFLQLSSGIIVGAIMHEQNLSALTAGLLSSAFYYVYTSFQIPVGILFDRYNTRTLLFINATLCALGCFVFAYGSNLPILFLGRLIIGAGSAFAFVGLSHLLRQHFPLKNYAFMVGVSETLGFTLTVFGMIGMGSFIGYIGWQCFIAVAGVLGLFIAFLCWNYIPDYQPAVNVSHHYKKQFILILKNKLVWINGLFVCLEFSVITVFGAMWAVPFVQLKLACSIKIASILTSMILLGAGLSCPIFGKLSIYFTKRKPLLQLSCLSTTILLLLTLYLPTNNIFIMGGLLFAMGLCCGAYMLAYSIANELAPADSLSTCTGFTNTLAMLSAPLLQPLVGYLLDIFSTTPDVYTLYDYQKALLIVPIALILASVLAHFLPEKITNHQQFPPQT